MMEVTGFDLFKWVATMERHTNKGMKSEFLVGWFVSVSESGRDPVRYFVSQDFMGIDIEHRGRQRLESLGYTMITPWEEDGLGTGRFTAKITK